MVFNDSIFIYRNIRLLHFPASFSFCSCPTSKWIVMSTKIDERKTIRRGMFLFHQIWSQLDGPARGIVPAYLQVKIRDPLQKLGHKGAPPASFPNLGFVKNTLMKSQGWGENFLPPMCFLFKIHRETCLQFKNKYASLCIVCNP